MVYISSCNLLVCQMNIYWDSTHIDVNWSQFNVKKIENTQNRQFLSCKWPQYHFSMFFMKVYIIFCSLLVCQLINYWKNKHIDVNFSSKSAVDFLVRGGNPKAPLSLASTSRAGEGATLSTMCLTTILTWRLVYPLKIRRVQCWVGTGLARRCKVHMKIINGWIWTRNLVHAKHQHYHYATHWVQNVNCLKSSILAQ